MGTAIETKRYRLFPSWRLLMILLCSMGTMAANVCYVNLSLAIVCMVNQSVASTDSDGNSSLSSVPVACRDKYTEAEHEYHGTYDWDRQTQAFVLSGVLWASLIIVFPSGWLVDYFGVKRILIFTNTVSAITSALVPLAAEAGFRWLFAIRFLNGFGYGMIWPTVLKVATNWAAQQELGIVVAICSSGFQVSALAMMGISGWFCSTIGWKFIFYFCAGFQVLWLLLFVWLFSSSPAESRFISEAELQFLLQNEVKKVNRAPLNKIPWKKLLTSIPVLTVFFATYCFWFFGSLVSFFLPTYLKEVLP